jgi:hypothetical protein
VLAAQSPLFSGFNSAREEEVLSIGEEEAGGGVGIHVRPAAAHRKARGGWAFHDGPADGLLGWSKDGLDGPCDAFFDFFFLFSFLALYYCTIFLYFSIFIYY